MITIAKIAVSFIPCLNRAYALPFWERCGGFDALIEESDEAWEALCREFNIEEGSIDRHAALRDAQTEFKTMERLGISFTDYYAEEFPAPLRDCVDAPLILFYKGRWSPKLPAIGVVGTRRASTRCRDYIDGIIERLASKYEPVVIVSGLAYGIDITAHKAAMDNDLPTYAIFGTGLSTVYPAMHRGEAERILECGGALISEFTSEAPIQRHFFLQRNRIIAGISRGVVIGESAERGGSISTARMAFSYGREVMAIPGRIDDMRSAGCNLLIKKNSASLVESGDDIAYIIGLRRLSDLQQRTLDFPSDSTETHPFANPSSCDTPAGPSPLNSSSLNTDSPSPLSTTTPFQAPRSKKKATPPPLTAEERNILTIMEKRYKGIHIDELALESGLPISELPLLLTQLEIYGKITSLPGNLYKINK